MQRCLHRYVDEGCLNGTALACAPGGAYFASGSSSGVVNVYDWRQAAAAGAAAAAPAAGGAALPEAPLAARPLKAVLNLTTSISCLAFNPDAQVLAQASHAHRDALRLVHLPSLTVFSNWPTAGSPLHYVHCLAFRCARWLVAGGGSPACHRHTSSSRVCCPPPPHTHTHSQPRRRLLGGGQRARQGAPVSTAPLPPGVTSAWPRPTCPVTSGGARP